MLVINSLKNNKQTTLIFLLSIVTAFTLLFLTGLLFSSIYDYLLKESIRTHGDYHVSVKTDLKNYEDFSVIKKIKWQDDYIQITYNNIKDVYKNTDKLCHKTKCVDVIYNNNYLSLKGISKNENLLGTLKNMTIFILLILFFSSGFIIYNVYKIFLFRKYKQISILQSIGMTLKELRKMLLTENLLLSIIGMVISFIFSILIMIILLNIFNSLLNNVLRLSININFLGIVVIFIVGLIIFISVIPIFKASKISVLNISKMDIKRTKVKKHFKNPIVNLSYLSYKRSRSHYKPVIISLCIFIILYFSFNLILQYGLKIIYTYVAFPNYDIKVEAKNDDNIYAYLEDFAKKNKTKYKIYKECKMNVMIDGENYKDKKSKSVNLTLIDGDNYFLNKSKTLKMDKKIVLEEKSLFNDSITIKVNDKLLALKEAHKNIYGYSILDDQNLLAATSNIDEICSPNLVLFMNSQNNLDSKTYELLNSDYEIIVVNAKKGREIVNNIILSIKILLYSVLGLTSLMSFSTIISSSYLSLQYRRKEFGILKCLGLTHNQFKEMMILESLFIVLKAFLITLPILLVIDLFVKETVNSVISVSGVFVIKETLFCLLLCIIVVRIIMELSTRKMKNSEILRLINSDNI